MDKCLICEEQNPEMNATDVVGRVTCSVCGCPYTATDESVVPSLDEGTMQLLKKFWADTKSNVCPDSMCLMDSVNSTTTQTERTIWKSWYKKNMALFKKPDFTMSCTKKGNIIRLPYGKENIQEVEVVAPPQGEH